MDEAVSITHRRDRFAALAMTVASLGSPLAKTDRTVLGPRDSMTADDVTPATRA